MRSLLAKGALALLFFLPAFTSPAASIGMGTTQKLTAADVLVLEGTGYDLGQKQGFALKAAILHLYNDWLLPKLKAVPLLFEIYAKAKVHNMEPFIPQDLKDEIRGMSDAVGIDYNMALIVNAVPDIMGLVSKPFGCSTFVVLPERSAEGGLIYGRNLDYEQSELLRQYWHPTVFARPGKHRVLSINVPGMSGVLTAINDHGVMMSRMTSYSRHISSHGVPSMLLFRHILEEADTAADAGVLYRQAARTVAVNVMVADSRSAQVLEATGTQFYVRTPNQAGVLYSANHYETPALKDGIHGRDERWSQLARFDNNTRKILADDVLETLALSAGKGKNLLAAVVDYSRKTMTFGGDADSSGGGIAARGKLYEIDLSEFLPGF